jgi:hypothetical protein
VAQQYGGVAVGEGPAHVRSANVPGVDVVADGERQVSRLVVGSHRPQGVEDVVRANHRVGDDRAAKATGG